MYLDRWFMSIVCSLIVLLNGVYVIRKLASIDISVIGEAAFNQFKTTMLIHVSGLSGEMQLAAERTSQNADSGLELVSQRREKSSKAVTHTTAAAGDRRAFPDH
ncbi:hypothetical protein [Paenibacillus tarimensis]|uniref:hypothetical protein n=1 Tax=Paenibacillus tarimensis TaxID=416012 RepID=UPI001F48692D|nr:hypothetical protein [Paenibacillus tarimensis]MCF2946000.1 hypothetical protein [Paenibacillus tarimensis]